MLWLYQISNYVWCMQMRSWQKGQPMSLLSHKGRDEIRFLVRTSVSTGSDNGLAPSWLHHIHLSIFVCKCSLLCISLTNSMRIGKYFQVIMIIYESVFIFITIGQISQTPQCTCSISHNAPLRTEMCTYYILNGVPWDMSLVHYGICAAGIMF